MSPGNLQFQELQEIKEMNSQYSKNKRIILSLGLLLALLAMACQSVIPGRAPATVESSEPLVEATVEPAVQVVAPVISSDDQSLVNLYERVNPAVVNITIYSQQGELLLPQSQGSGFVYDNQGHIVTNAHVVHGAEQIEVTFSEGLVRSASVIGEDLNSDLAVVKVENLPSGINPLPLGDMQSLAVGQSVVAIGNPFGLEGTLTRGIISALGRSIPALTPFTIPESIQTDAAINPGNSGGPLLNLSGEVVGVNAQIETDGTNASNLGIGFAIPVSIVKLVVPDLIAKGEHEWAWLGVSGLSVTPALVQAMDLPIDSGAYMASVISDGPSAKAGLRGANETVTVDGRQIDIGGDVITAVDGQPVNTFDDLLIYIALNTRPGQEVTLTILREGESQEITVTLEKRPATLDQQQLIP